MSRTRRVWNIIGAIFTIQGTLLLLLIPEEAFTLIAVFVGFLLTYKGLKFIVYYLTHAQHMVGGKWLFLVGILLFDLGTCAWVLFDRAQAIVIIYVVSCHLVTGALGIVRAVSSKGDGNPGWKIDLAKGIGNLALAALCLIFINSVTIPVWIYCAGVIYSSILDIVASCRRTAIVYIQ